MSEYSIRRLTRAEFVEEWDNVEYHGTVRFMRLEFFGGLSFACSLDYEDMALFVGMLCLRGNLSYDYSEEWDYETSEDGVPYTDYVTRSYVFEWLHG